jgi:hypothetical protein
MEEERRVLGKCGQEFENYSERDRRFLHKLP